MDNESNFYDGFYDDFFENKNRPVKKKKNLSKDRNKYREKVLEYLELEFCEVGDWWKFTEDTINQNRVVAISIINDCFLDGVKINNAAGTVYEWLKGRNLI